MQNTRYTLLNKLQAKLGDAVTFSVDGDFYYVELILRG